MNCPSCSRANDDDKRFCTQCGAALTGSRCANGHTIPDGLTTCPFCPRPVQANPAGPAPAGREPTAAASAQPAAGGGRRKGTALVSKTELQESGVQVNRTAHVAPTALPTPTPPETKGSRGRTMYRAPGEPVDSGAPIDSELMPGPIRTLSSSSAPLIGFLVSFSTDRNGVYWPIRFGRTTIGSNADSHVCLTQAGVSTNHAEVMVRDNRGTPKIWITDSNSTNGTTLNGDDIFTERPDIKHGDTVGISEVELTVILLP